MPWEGHQPPQYVAWHVRTSEGESTTSFNKNVHLHVFHKESPTTVVPLYVAAMKKAEKLCPWAVVPEKEGTPIYISSNRQVHTPGCRPLNTQALSASIFARYPPLYEPRVLSERLPPSSADGIVAGNLTSLPIRFTFVVERSPHLLCAIAGTYYVDFVKKCFRLLLC